MYIAAVSEIKEPIDEILHLSNPTLKCAFLYSISIGPFQTSTILAVLPYCSMLVLNHLEKLYSVA